MEQNTSKHTKYFGIKAGLYKIIHTCTVESVIHSDKAALHFGPLELQAVILVQWIHVVGHWLLLQKLKKYNKLIKQHFDKK